MTDQPKDPWVQDPDEDADEPPAEDAGATTGLDETAEPIEPEAE